MNIKKTTTPRHREETTAQRRDSLSGRRKKVRTKQAPAQLPPVRVSHAHPNKLRLPLSSRCALARASVFLLAGRRVENSGRALPELSEKQSF
jgi:hypothetical protein